MLRYARICVGVPYPINKAGHSADYLCVVRSGKMEPLAAEAVAEHKEPRGPVNSRAHSQRRQTSTQPGFQPAVASRMGKSMDRQRKLACGMDGNVFSVTLRTPEECIPCVPPTQSSTTRVSHQYEYQDWPPVRTLQMEHPTRMPWSSRWDLGERLRLATNAMVHQRDNH